MKACAPRPASPKHIAHIHGAKKMHSHSVCLRKEVFIMPGKRMRANDCFQVADRAGTCLLLWPARGIGHLQLLTGACQIAEEACSEQHGCGSKPCTPWHLGVHPPQNGGIGYDPWRHVPRLAQSSSGLQSLFCGVRACNKHPGRGGRC